MVLLEARHVKAALSAMVVKTDRKDARWWPPLFCWRHVGTLVNYRRRDLEGLDVMSVVDRGEAARPDVP